MQLTTTNFRRRQTSLLPMLRALTLSVTHPMMVGEPMAPPDIVKLFLYGVSGQDPSC